MKGTRTELINAMEAERNRRRLNHQDFSALLRISKSYWTMIRKGDRRPTLYVLQTILQQVPELGPYVDSYMRQGNDGENDPEKSSPKNLPKNHRENRGVAG